MESNITDRRPQTRETWKRALGSKGVRLLAVGLTSLVLLLSLSGAAVFRYSVLIVDGSVRTIVLTSQDDPALVLKAEGISVGPYDEIVYEEAGGNEKVLTILRAHRVQVTADGTTQSIYRTGGTVREALEALGIPVGDEDYVNVSLSEAVCGDMEICINRVTRREVTRESAIPFSVTEIPTRTLDTGDTWTLSEGTDGLRTTTVRQTLLDGVVVGEEVIGEDVVVEPVSSRVLVGDPTAPVSELIPDEPIQLDSNGNPVEYKYKVTGKATAYSALGKPTKLRPGAVAMDLRDFTRGTKLYIKTPDGSFVYGYSEVRDTGTAMMEDLCLVDLFFNTYRESCLFGARTVDIYVLV